MPCDIVPTPDGGEAFLCSRSQAAKLSPPRCQVWCPLRGGARPCGWAGEASKVAAHLADQHGRRYEAG